MNGRCLGLLIGLSCVVPELAWAAEPGVSSAAQRGEWLSLETSADCRVSLADLVLAIDERIVGQRDATLSVRVRLTSAEDGTHTVIDLASGRRVVASKRLHLANCEEAVDAVAVVVALALSREPNQSSADVPRAPVAEPAAEPQLDAALDAVEAGSVDSISPALVWRKEPASSAEAARSMSQGSVAGVSWGAVFKAGVDRGSVRQGMGVIAVGAERVLGRSEFRGFAWYGLATRQEEATQATGLRREQLDYGALALAYCYALTASRWLATCAGLEVGGARSLDERQDETGSSRVEAVDFSLAPTLGALLRFPEGLIHPVLELGALAPLPGLDAGGQRLALRASMGAELVW